MPTSSLHFSQSRRYDGFYSDLARTLSNLRFDVTYRARRLHEVLCLLGVDVNGQSVLDLGFGTGQLLLSFPSSCTLLGVDVSPSAVEAAQRDRRFTRFSSARFVSVPEQHPEQMPDVTVNLAITSHLLEHVPNDALVLSELFKRIQPGGTLVVFVPIEEPDYILFHRRNYSLQSIVERVEQAGFELQRAEGSMYVNGHIWKLLTIPSRRRWPVLGTAVDALRMASLGLLPYATLKRLDHALFLLGFGARQALVVAKRPHASD